MATTADLLAQRVPAGRTDVLDGPRRRCHAAAVEAIVEAVPRKR